jgi:AraC family transcriptional regulator
LIKDRELSVFEISHQLGFSSNSSFTKSFKKHYNQSPSNFRKYYNNELSKIRQVKSKIGQELKSFEDYICEMENNKNWVLEKGNISIKNSSEIHLATIYHIGDKGIEEKFRELIHWANKKGLTNNSDFKMGTIYYDSYKITAADKVRKDAFFLLESPVIEDDTVVPKSIPVGKFIIANIELPIEDFSKAWSGLFNWMNENGFSKRDAPAFEIYHNNFNDHPEKKCLVDLYIPII